MNHALVLQLARFGDLVQSKRLLLSLQASGAQVHLCLDESLAGLARRVYPFAALHPVCAHGTGLAGKTGMEQAAALLGRNMPVFRELKDLRPEAVYNLNFSPLNFRVVSLFDPDTVRGHCWVGGQEVVGPWARLAMRWSGMRRLGVNIADFWAWHHPAPVAASEVNPPAQGRGGGLGVVMAGRESRRSLPPGVLANLIGTLRSRLGNSRVALIGTSAEDKGARALMRELPARQADGVENLCGRTGLAELCDVVGGLDLLLTPDTGAMHLAAHLGVPVLATFLSSAWCFETGPYGQGHRVLQAERDCLPCLESRPCPTNVECLHPFADPMLVRYLSTGQTTHLPQGLLDMDSAFDGLGATFAARAGADPHVELRKRFRAFLLRHLRREDGFSSGPEGDFAQRLYLERDWLAPDESGRHWDHDFITYE